MTLVQGLILYDQYFSSRHRCYTALGHSSSNIQCIQQSSSPADVRTSITRNSLVRLNSKLLAYQRFAENSMERSLHCADQTRGQAHALIYTIIATETTKEVEISAPNVSNVPRLLFGVYP